MSSQWTFQCLTDFNDERKMWMNIVRNRQDFQTRVHCYIKIGINK